MRKKTPTNLYYRLSRWRWQIPAVVVVSLVVLELLEHVWVEQFPQPIHELGEQVLLVLELIFYVIFFPWALWWGITLLRENASEMETARQALQESHTALQDANQRLEFLIRINRRLAAAEDEDELINAVLELSLTVIPAVGSSLIRVDEHGQRIQAMHMGDLRSEVYEAWVAHLTGGEAHQMCMRCSVHWSDDPASCPLLSPLQEAMQIKKVHCLPLSRGNQEYGKLNIYLGDVGLPSEREKILLDAMGREISMALESQRLRSRELETLYRLQQARKQRSLQDTLTNVLDHTGKAMEVDGGALFLADKSGNELTLLTEIGQTLDGVHKLVRGLAGGALQAKTPLVIHDLEHDIGENTPGSLLIAPLQASAGQEALGSLVLWASETDHFTRRHTRLLGTVASQMALLVDNHQLYVQARSRAALAERARLSREIHDGLAQTLGYLKLRTAQIDRWLEEGEVQRAKAGFGALRGLLGDAYLDAREAIDGLRIHPEQGKDYEWLHQIVEEFQNMSAISVKLQVSPSTAVIPLEVQAQLQRIVQESLSNVRKHAQATQAWVDWNCDADWLSICISDDGHGFDPADVPAPARHGLRIMRERAELLGADFQIQSEWEQGTQVKIILPLRQLEHIND